jgi:osmotically-inducible protein OsmY
VQWHYQRNQANRIVRNLKGAKGVTDLITVKPQVRVTDVDERVSQALKRSADLDARSIWVTAENGTLHLHGHVHPSHEKETAERAVAAPGVSHVDNKITMTP